MPGSLQGQGIEADTEAKFQRVHHSADIDRTKAQLKIDRPGR